MEELPSTALKWPFPKTLNGRFWRLSSAIIIGGTAAFSKIWLGKLKYFEVIRYSSRILVLHVGHVGGEVQKNILSVLLWAPANVGEN